MGMKRAKTASLATKAGTHDGRVRATLKPDHFDPTGWFIRRPELAESDRAEYIVAYRTAYTATLKVMHPGLGCSRGAK
jgi:hypothetical protein